MLKVAQTEITSTTLAKTGIKSKQSMTGHNIQFPDGAIQLQTARETVIRSKQSIDSAGCTIEFPCYSQVSEGSYKHGAPWASDGDDGGCHPVADGQGGVDDGQGSVPIAAEPRVILRYTVKYGFLRTRLIHVQEIDFPR